MQKQTCECCGEIFKAPELTDFVGMPTNTLEALCRLMGGAIYSSVCQKRQCQDYAQQQCDAFDQARKGE